MLLFMLAPVKERKGGGGLTKLNSPLFFVGGGVN